MRHFRFLNRWETVVWLDIRYEIYLNPDEIREALTKLAQDRHSLLVTGAGLRYWAETMESCMRISSIRMNTKSAIISSLSGHRTERGGQPSEERSVKHSVFAQI